MIDELCTLLRTLDQGEVQSSLHNAHRLLTRLSYDSSRTSTVGHWEQGAGQALYLTALLLCVHDQAQDAVPLLHSLGCTHMLNPELFLLPSQSTALQGTACTWGCAPKTQLQLSHSHHPDEQRPVPCSTSCRSGTGTHTPANCARSAATLIPAGVSWGPTPSQPCEPVLRLGEPGPAATAEGPAQGLSAASHTPDDPGLCLTAQGPGDQGPVLTGPQRQASPVGDNVPVVHAFDNALPDALVVQLQAMFAPNASFWQSHNYDDPSTPFFSYMFNMDCPAVGPVEEAAHVLFPVIRELLAGTQPPQPAVPCSSTCQTGPGWTVEWWAHKRPVDAPLLSTHQLHFDTDERHFGAHRDPGSLTAQHLPHPVFSSVLYLSAPVGAAGTLVLQQTLHTADLAGVSGHYVTPEVNRWAVWPGNLLHGVLPSTAQGVHMGSHAASWPRRPQSTHCPGVSPTREKTSFQSATAEVSLAVNAQPKSPGQTLGVEVPLVEVPSSITLREQGRGMQGPSWAPVDRPWPSTPSQLAGQLEAPLLVTPLHHHGGNTPADTCASPSQSWMGEDSIGCRKRRVWPATIDVAGDRPVQRLRLSVAQPCGNVAASGREHGEQGGTDQHGGQVETGLDGEQGRPGQPCGRDAAAIVQPHVIPPPGNKATSCPVQQGVLGLTDSASRACMPPLDNAAICDNMACAYNKSAAGSDQVAHSSWLTPVQEGEGAAPLGDATKMVGRGSAQSEQRVSLILAWWRADVPGSDFGEGKGMENDANRDVTVHGKGVPTEVEVDGVAAVHNGSVEVENEVGRVVADKANRACEQHLDAAGKHNSAAAHITNLRHSDSTSSGRVNAGSFDAMLGFEGHDSLVWSNQGRPGDTRVLRPWMSSSWRQHDMHSAQPCGSQAHAAHETNQAPACGVLGASGSAVLPMVVSLSSVPVVLGIGLPGQCCRNPHAVVECKDAWREVEHLTVHVSQDKLHGARCSLHTAPLPPLRFFVRGIDDIRGMYESVLSIGR